MINLERPPTANEKTQLIFNIGGKRYETFLSTLRAIPGTRLSWIADNYHLLRHSPLHNPVKDEYFFDRNPTCFEAIVNYFRTGQLHYPNNVCGHVFESELKFWGVEEEQMQTCCWEAYAANREKDIQLKGFKGPGLQDSELKNNQRCSKSHKYRLKVLDFFDDANSSTPAKVYIYITLVSCTDKNHLVSSIPILNMLIIHFCFLDIFLLWLYFAISLHPFANNGFDEFNKRWWICISFNYYNSRNCS